MKKNGVYFGAFFFILGLALFLINQKSNKIKEKETYNGIGLVAKASAIIKTNYVDTVSPEKIFNGALRNMGASLDYFSTYLTKKETDKLNNIKELGWPGFKFIKKYGFPIVTHILPKYKDKIKKGDIVKIINGKSTYGVPYLNVKYMLMGTLDKKIDLVLLRGEERKRIKFSILPVNIGYEAKKINDQFTIIKVYFIKSSDYYLNIKEMIHKSNQNIILDLRNLYYIKNDESFKLAKLFLKKSVTVKFKLNNSEKDITLVAQLKGSKNIYVLTDYQTFEESEMIGYVLKLSGVKIIGEKTIGLSGLIYPLKYKDGSEFLILSGIIKGLYKKGLKPDIKLKSKDFEKFEFNPEKYINGKKKL